MTNELSTRSGWRVQPPDQPRLQRFRRWVTVLGLLAVATSLTACGLSSPIFEDAFERALMLTPEPVPPYHQLVADALKDFKQQRDFAHMEISEPRWAEHLGGPAWLICVKFNPKAVTYYYAFFIRKEEVVETRFAVGTDRCSERSFAPFDLSAAD